MLSQKCKCAIRAVIYLSSDFPEPTKKGGKEISAALKIPQAFTGRILHELSQQNIISSLKGPGGGFYMTAENLQLPILKIIETIDGLSFFKACGLGLEICSEKRPCPIHETFKICRNQMFDLFKTKKIKDIAHDITLHKMFIVR
ncbi:MAG: Rrf2 family transcriptional regulator [Crocinitomicaceae bacterium]|nr:Rrf2 family transcriptional regulator [Crocinitomicaceae bacterium]